MTDRQKLIDETQKVTDRIERFVVNEIKSAPEDNPVLTETLGDIRMHILKLKYKFSMSTPGKDRRTPGSGRRTRQKLDVGSEGCRRNSIFGRRETDSQEFSIREEHSHKAPMFGGGRR